MTTLEKLEQKLEKAQQEASERYGALVKAVADGKQVAEAEATLGAAGKDLADLKRDVAERQQRSQWQAKLAAMPELEQQAADLKAKIAEADRKLEAADKRHSETVGPLSWQVEQLGRELASASAARQNLLRSCPETLREEFARAEAKARRLVRLQGAIGTELATLKQQRTEAAIEAKYNVAGAKERLERIDVFLGQAKERQEETKRKLEANKQERQRLAEQMINA